MSGYGRVDARWQAVFGLVIGQFLAAEAIAPGVVPGMNVPTACCRLERWLNRAISRLRYSATGTEVSSM